MASSERSGFAPPESTGAENGNQDVVGDWYSVCEPIDDFGLEVGRTIFSLLNNCFADYAQRNAKELAGLLGE